MINDLKYKIIIHFVYIIGVNMLCFQKGYPVYAFKLLSVDSFNGYAKCLCQPTNIYSLQLCGRPIRVDHVKEYRRPQDEKGNEVVEEGCAPKTPSPSPPPSPSQVHQSTKLHNMIVASSYRRSPRSQRKRKKKRRRRKKKGRKRS